MTREVFVNQVLRLEERFSRKAFGKEFNELLFNLMKHEDAGVFHKIVDDMITQRKHTNAPLIVDFREAIYRHNQNDFKKTCGAFNRQIESNKPLADEGLRNYLAYLGVKSISEAIKLRAGEIKNGKVGKRNAPANMSEEDVYNFARLEIQFQQ